jgi:hypothetical protein
VDGNVADRIALIDDQNRVINNEEADGDSDAGGSIDLFDWRRESVWSGS